MSPDFPRGAVRPGTVGVLYSGRLVLVLAVTRHRAILASLPEQDEDKIDWVQETHGVHQVYPQPIKVSRPFFTSPFITLEAVDLGTLTPVQREFVELNLPDGCVVNWPEKPATITQEGQTVVDLGDNSSVVADHLEDAATFIDEAGPVDEELIEKIEERLAEAGITTPATVTVSFPDWDQSRAERIETPEVKITGKRLEPTGRPPIVPHLRREEQFKAIHEAMLELCANGRRPTKEELVQAVKRHPFYKTYRGEKMIRYFVGHYIRAGIVRWVGDV